MLLLNSSIADRYHTDKAETQLSFGRIFPMIVIICKLSVNPSCKSSMNLSITTYGSQFVTGHTTKISFSHNRKVPHLFCCLVRWACRCGRADIVIAEIALKDYTRFKKHRGFKPTRSTCDLLFFPSSLTTTPPPLFPVRTLLLFNMGFSANSASETLSSLNVSDSSSVHTPSTGFPLVRTNKFKYLPNIVSISPMDSFCEDPTSLSDLMAWDKDFEERQEFIRMYMRPIAQLTNIPFSHRQQLATILEEEGEL